MEDFFDDDDILKQFDQEVLRDRFGQMYTLENGKGFFKHEFISMLLDLTFLFFFHQISSLVFFCHQISIFIYFTAYVLLKSY